MKKVPLAGGPAVPICTVKLVWGASWGADANIIFGKYDSGLYRVSEAGGTPEKLHDRQEGENSLCWPQILPRDDVVPCGIYGVRPREFGALKALNRPDLRRSNELRPGVPA